MADPSSPRLDGVKWQSRTRSTGERIVFADINNLSDPAAVIRDLQKHGYKVSQSKDGNGRGFLVLKGDDIEKIKSDIVNSRKAPPKISIELNQNPAPLSANKWSENKIRFDGASPAFGADATETVSLPSEGEPVVPARKPQPVSNAPKTESKGSSLSYDPGVPKPEPVKTFNPRDAVFRPDFEGFDPLPEPSIKTPDIPAKTITTDIPHASHSPVSSKAAGGAGVAMSAMGLSSGVQSGDVGQMIISGADLALNGADMVKDFKGALTKGNMIITLADGAYQVLNEDGLAHKGQRAVGVAVNAGLGATAAATTAGAIAAAGVTSSVAVIGAPIVAAAAVGYGIAVISDTAIETARIYEKEAQRFSADFDGLKHGTALRYRLGTDFVEELKKLDGTQATQAVDENGLNRNALIMKDGTTLFIGGDGGLTNASDLDLSNPDHFTAMQNALDKKIENFKYDEHHDEYDLKILQSAKEETNSPQFQKRQQEQSTKLAEFRQKFGEQVLADTKAAAQNKKAEPVNLSAEFNDSAAKPPEHKLGAQDITARSAQEFDLSNPAHQARIGFEKGAGEYYALNNGYLELKQMSDAQQLRQTLGNKAQIGQLQDGNYWVHAKDNLERGLVVLTQDMPAETRNELSETMQKPALETTPQIAQSDPEFQSRTPAQGFSI